LKVEFYDRRSWATRAEAMTAVGDWIERVYNRRRRHSRLGMRAPLEFETDTLIHRGTGLAASRLASSPKIRLTATKTTSVA
jgi:transposase InsO family protein